MKRYEFTGEVKKAGIFGNITVRRIRATVSFGIVKAGELGGWIEKEENLYVDEESNAWVYGNAEVYGDAKVYGNAEVYGDAKVYGNAKVYGDAKVYGNAKVCGNAEVYGDAKVCGNAEVLQGSHLLVIGPIGSRNSFTTFFRDKDNEIVVRCGCFLGKIDKFLEKVKETHGDSRYAFVYRAAVEVAKAHIESLTPAEVARTYHFMTAESEKLLDYTMEQLVKGETD